MDCIFCKIIAGDIPCQKVYEDEHVLAFRDIHPAAPVHVLVVPKRHVQDIQSLKAEDMPLVTQIHEAVKKIAAGEGVAETGYRLVVNNGEGAGQTVLHLHYHLLGGKVLGERIL